MQISLDNPPGCERQNLYGTCGTMCPGPYLEECSSELEVLDGKPVYAIKQFKRTVNDEVGNTGPEFIRTKQAIHASMQTLRTWLRGYRCASLLHYVLVIVLDCAHALCPHVLLSMSTAASCLGSCCAHISL